MEYEVNIGFPGPGSAEQSIGDLIEDPKEALDALGKKLREILMSLRPDRLAFNDVVGADSLELEIAFAIEAAGGKVLNLIISPKGSVSCKAKLTWKRPAPPGSSGAGHEHPASG